MKTGLNKHTKWKLANADFTFPTASEQLQRQIATISDAVAKAQVESGDNKVSSDDDIAEA